MKKQNAKQIKPSEMTDMVGHHKMKEVAPPSEANRGMDGRYSIDRAKAAMQWFKAAKEHNPSKEFLGVDAETLDPKSHADKKGMLHKKK